MGPQLALAADRVLFPGRSITAKLVEFGTRRTVRPIIRLWAASPVTVFPPNLLDQAGRLIPVPHGTKRREVKLPGTRCEWVTGAGVEAALPAIGGQPSGGVVLYLHGGAFLSCGLNTHRRLVSRISSAAGQPVLNVGYRQMPSQPIAESIADGVEAFDWLLDHGYRPGNITIAGDSAGGFLAFAVARAVLDRGSEQPAAIVGLSALLDFDASGKRAHRNAHRCPTFPVQAFERLAEVADQFDTERGIQGRRISPVDMPLDDLPPVLLQVGSREVLLADAEEMASKLARTGIRCELQIFEGQVHVFQAADPWVPEARTAVAELGEFIVRQQASVANGAQRQNTA